jgi:hypothetical protein
LCIYPIRNGETAFKIHTQNGMAWTLVAQLHLSQYWKDSAIYPL